MVRSLVLYVHPWGHLNDLVIPAGAVACMNAIPPPKLGRYAFEVSDDEIREAALVAIDVHWALALTGFAPLVAHVRRVAPDVPIVVGGISAAHLAEELLDAYPIDYALRGDAETSFAALVAAVREGRRPDAIPNVHARGAPEPPRRRMGAEEFDATDSVCLDWFPTLARATDLDAVAFPAGRTIVAARGCPMRCPTCYGSHASTYGAGHLVRSPARTAALMRDAERAGARNPRVVVGKPSRRELGELFAALAAEGPFHVESSIGFYLCRAPSDAELDALDAAFDGPVSLSVVPPDEHVPALSPERLAEEQAEWRRVAAHVSRSRNLRLDVWATTGRDTTSLREELGVTDASRVSVSSGAVWSMTRPSDGRALSLAEARASVAALWTFYAARLLSPALARLLAPFRFLDEVDDGLDALLRPASPELAPFHEAILRSWRTHRLPMMPGFAIDAVPVALSRPATRRSAEGTTLRGDLSVAEPGTARAIGAKIELRDVVGHRGVALEAELGALPATFDAIALVPRGAASDGQGWLDALSSRGLVVMRAPPRDRGEGSLRIDLRVQDARAFLLDRDGEILRRGTADLSYFHVAAPRGTRSRADAHAVGMARGRDDQAR